LQLVLEEARLEAIEPGIDEDGLVAEGDLPAIGAEPREVDTGRTRPAPTWRRLRAFRCAGREQRPPQVRGSRDARRHASRQEASPGPLRIHEAHIGLLSGESGELRG